MNVKHEEGLLLCPAAPQDTKGAHWLLQGVAALALFVGFAGPMGAFCGLWERISPAPLLLGGTLVIGARMVLKAAGKEKWFFPGLLTLLLAASLLGHGVLVDGACAAWNQLSCTWTALTGRMLPILQTETENAGVGLFVFCVILGAVLALAACACGRWCRTGAAALLPVSLAALSLATGAEFPAAWLVPALFASLILLLSSGWSLQAADAGVPTALGFLAVLPVTAALILMLQHPACRQWVQQLQEKSEEAVHTWRYETAYTVLPEGDFSRPVPEAEGYTALQVTMETPERLFLRGFTGDSFNGDRWETADNRLLEENKETLYWLYRDYFYPQGQLSAAVETVQMAAETQQITVRNINGCSEIFYIPHMLAAESFPALAPEKLGQSMVAAEGLRGEREYSFQTLCGTAEVIQEALQRLQGTEDETALRFRQAESGYREVVRACDLQVPESFIKALGELLDACCAPHGGREGLTVAQAQASALDFLALCFGESGMDIPLPLVKAAGTTYQYTTAAALALRYYGIPARYAEGYEITADMASQAQPGEAIQVGNTCARAWVEVYQDGIGWMPMELTPGFEALAPQESASGIAPVGVGGVDPDSEIGSAAGTDDSLTLSQGTEVEPDSTQQENFSGLLSGGTVVKLARALRWIMALLVLLALALVILHRAAAQRRRKKRFGGEDISASIGWIYADAAALLSAMGLDRGGGSMELVCDKAMELDADYGLLCRDMTQLNQEALFSSHALQETKRQEMLDFHSETLRRMKKTVSWHRRLWMQWVLCLY